MIGRWGDDLALLRRPDGTTVEVVVPEELRARIDVGVHVELLSDGAVDWRLTPESRG